MVAAGLQPGLTAGLQPPGPSAAHILSLAMSQGLAAEGKAPAPFPKLPVRPPHLQRPPALRGFSHNIKKATLAEEIAKLPGTSKAKSAAVAKSVALDAATAKAPPSGSNGISGNNGPPPQVEVLAPEIQDMKEISPALAALMGDCL